MKRTAAQRKAKTVVESLLIRSPELAREVTLILGSGRVYLGPWFERGGKYHREHLDGNMVAATVQPQTPEPSWKGGALTIGDSDKSIGGVQPVGDIFAGSRSEVMAAVDGALRERGVILLEDPSYLPASHRPKTLTGWQRPDQKKWVRKDSSTGQVKALVSQSNRRYSWKVWESSGQMRQGTTEAKRFHEHEDALQAACDACDAVLSADGWLET